MAFQRQQGYDGDEDEKGYGDVIELHTASIIVSRGEVVVRWHGLRLYRRMVARLGRLYRKVDAAGNRSVRRRTYRRDGTS
ncbi:hypothetical protein GCM10009540_23560 [Streptomyces turgidiscabies]